MTYIPAFDWTEQVASNVLYRTRGGRWRALNITARQGRGVMENIGLNLHVISDIISDKSYSFQTGAFFLSLFWLPILKNQFPM